MSAKIIPFPGRPEITPEEHTKPLRAIINIDQMQAYRIMGLPAMHKLGNAQANLVQLVSAYESSGVAPGVGELTNLMRCFAEVMRQIDFAHKFLVVHGDPVGDTANYETLQHRYGKEVKYPRTALVDLCVLELLGGLDFE